MPRSPPKPHVYAGGVAGQTLTLGGGPPSAYHRNTTRGSTAAVCGDGGPPGRGVAAANPVASSAWNTRSSRNDGSVVDSAPTNDSTRARVDDIPRACPS